MWLQNPASANATIPVVTIRFAFAALTMTSFTPDRQQALIAAVAAAAPTSDNVAVTLNNIVGGSVAVDVIVEFLDGSIGEAQYLANLAQSAVSRLHNLVLSSSASDHYSP